MTKSGQQDKLHHIKTNGYHPSDSSGDHSAAWIRRSLNLLQSSLNRPLALPRLDEDCDEEMEIDEEGVEDSAVDFCNANVLNNCDIIEENEQEINMKIEYWAEPTENKSISGCSGSKLLNEEPSSAIVSSSLSCPVGEPDKGVSSATSVSDASQDIPSPSMNRVSPSSHSISPCNASPLLKSPTPRVSPTISSSRKSLRTSSMLSASEKDLHNGSVLGSKIVLNKSSSNVLSSQTAPNSLTKTENGCKHMPWS
ncbi:hypothetical protein L6164_012196 [Bauhinia variegata]|uniref:Uncharacterized protein n=1 Tax=Bauhinia variegata TaxID=167791 RepID=A0ACB9P8C0_BAUVA|nr:hypothetical protein L6164_012196 [Bauhinia variegata]